MDKDLKEIVGQNIFYLRTINHLTQSELGEKLNYSDKAISKWERGDGLPDLYVIDKLCKLFGVNADYILSEHSDQDKKVDTRPIKHARRLIANIALIATWTVALLVFIILAIAMKKYVWQIFIFAIPVVSIVMTVFCFMWEKGRGALITVSGIIWGTLLTWYFGVGNYGNWVIFLLGIPAELILFLCLRMKITIKFTQKEKIAKENNKEENKEKTEK